MSAVLRSALALVLKEIQHHATALLLVLGWSLMMVPLTLTMAFANGGTSFASAGTALAYYYGPVVVMLVTRRLIVQEYADGTVRFLDALPAPAWLQFAVKYLLIWAVSLSIVGLIVAPLLLLASLRELVTPLWFLQLVFAVALYTTAWTAVVATVAQTGRFRHWIWILGLLAVSYWESDWQLWTWHAALGNPTDATRHALPLLEFGLSVAWWALWFGLAALLATWHGGAVPARCFRASSTRERVTGASVVLFVLLLIEVLPEVGLSRMSGWETLPDEHGAHVIGDVGDWPRAVDAARTRAGAPLSARLVLAQSYEEPSPGPRALCDQLDAAQVIVRVRQTPRAGDVARALDCLVFQHGSGISSLPTRQHFAVDGVGLWAADPTGELVDLRAAVALREGLTRSLLADWRTLRQQLGPDLAAAVGAVGLRILDDDKREPWLRDIVLRRVPWSTLALFGVGEAPDIASLTPEEHLDRWWRALETIARDTDVQHVAPWSGRVMRGEERISNLDIAWSVAADPTAQLVVTPVDPLRGVPVPDAHLFSRWVTPLAEPDGSRPTWFGSADRVRAAVRVWRPSLQGYLWTPVMEVGG